jgi:hypothetical protein
MHLSFTKIELGDAVTLRSTCEEDILLFSERTEAVFVTRHDVLIYLGVRQTPEFSSGYEFVLLCPTGSVATLPTGVGTIRARRLV